MVRYFIPLGILVILGIFLFIGLSLNPRDIGSTRIDKPAPEFNLPQVMAMDNTLTHKDFLGKVSLFNAWASWCVSCRQEHEVLMQLAQQHHVAIYGLNYKDTLEEARSVLERTGSPYIASGFDKTGRVGLDWGVTGTPETFVIDKQGIVRFKNTGPLTEHIVQEEILPLIRQLEKNQSTS
ncbi:MAG: DsbE family thiol:disulfide interchange protein [Pseudomonadota bacterium]|nr:DsbE family thiol:disulfide interchange protein [Pseudomonadota bacterium]